MRILGYWPALLVLFILLPGPAEAQRRRKSDEVPWPPERAYSRLFLGGALQDVFGRHYDFCGFTRVEGQRDYTPPTLEQFLGKRSLRTRVEKADINGGNLLSYVFARDETSAPLDRIRYRPDNLLFNAETGVEMLPRPRDGFDAFVLTKNCGGYLKAALDAGWKPPYAAFAAALDTDARRSSSVLAMAGSFVSPLAEVLGANDARTAELMARLWQFYQEHPEYQGEAYYLKHFDGIVIKHLTDSKEVIAAEQSVGLNVALPFSAKITADLSHRQEKEQTFTGSDWETIVYTDFTGPYTREAMFYPLPGPEEIADFFATRATVAVQPKPLREGASHQHTVTVAGLPQALAGAGWLVHNLREGVYEGTPSLSTAPVTGGIAFTVTGYAAPDLFRPRPAESVSVSYELTLPGSGAVPPLRIPVQIGVPASPHPLVDLSGTRFELRRQNTGLYAFQWHLAINIDDRENPLNGEGIFDTKNLVVGSGLHTLDARVVGSSYDTRRAVLTLTLESERSWPLDMIDDRNMRSYPVEAELCLPVRDGTSVCHRAISARLAVPRISAPATPQLPASPPSPAPGQG